MREAPETRQPANPQPAVISIKTVLAWNHGEAPCWYGIAAAAGRRISKQASHGIIMAPTTKLQLCLSASNLPRTSKKLTSPHVRARVMTIGPGHAAGPTLLGTTEVIKSCHPRFCTIFYLTYEFGSAMNFCVDLVQGTDEEKSKSIGVAHFEIGDIIGSRNKTKVKRLRKGGCVFATIEQSTDEGSGGRVVFQLSALRLDCKQGMLSTRMSRSEPSTFFEVARQTKTPAGNKFVAVYRSQPVLESYRPCWDRAEIDMASFCNGDADRPLKVSVFVHKKRGNHVLLGSFETTLNVMVEKAECRKTVSERDGYSSTSTGTYALQRPGSESREPSGIVAVVEGCILPEKENSINGNGTSNPFNSFRPPPIKTRLGSTGSAMSANSNCSEHDIDSPGSFTSVTIDMEALCVGPSFSDRVHAGLDVDLCVAIDFTSSNGDPRLPGTLHYRDEEGLNDYEETIVSIGKAISRYSKSKEFPVWGFGAKSSGAVRHIFQVGTDAVAKDIVGVLDAYKSVFLTDLTMSGPTDITSVVKAAASRASKFEDGALRYGILLVITDGIVSDADATKTLLHAISDLPLTVLIVGIGAADFTVMGEIVEHSNSTSRANVSFVSYREHQDDPTSLSTAALRDIPDHIAEYFAGNVK